MTVSSDLLEILACPETKQPLAVASDDVLSKINAEIQSGSLRNRGGVPVSKSVDEALVREDGKILYVVDDGIPVMLIEESIEL
jgi:uncharacterized protein YbaR (Trm112 family)